MNQFEKYSVTQEPAIEQTGDVLDKLKNKVALKEQNGEDATTEKIELIGKIHNIKYSDEEKQTFDMWRQQIPQNSMEKPICVTDLSDIVNLLPEVPNYTENKVNLFFSSPDNFSETDLDKILTAYSRRNPSFEISITQHSENLVSIGIGDKSRDKSMRLDGKYFGHYHPTGFSLEHLQELPASFVSGMLPSPGDIRGYLKNPDAVKGGTRIYSKNGYVLITPHGISENPDKIVEEYKKLYFDLFLGKNKFGFVSNKDVARYFRDNFQIDLSFFPLAEDQN
jgi:hypothetical protein